MGELIEHRKVSSEYQWGSEYLLHFKQKTTTDNKQSNNKQTKKKEKEMVKEVKDTLQRETTVRC